jgi:phage repressor protein C with HTH and peptisase S24 domain
MLSHGQIWEAIDRLANEHRLTPSGLARRAGLDPTSFNKSKRSGQDGRMRWPSTESIAKVLDATGTTIEEFLGLMRPGALPIGPTKGAFAPQPNSIPLLGITKAGAGDFFDDGGCPVGHGWDVVEFPALPAQKANIFALEVQGDSMMPLYRNHDILIVKWGAQIRRHDRVVVKTRGGEVMAKVVAHKGDKSIELTSLNPEHPNRTIDLADVEWMARILWVSQ